MPFKRLEKPIGADPDYEADFNDDLAIGGLQGLMFKMEIMCITHNDFKENGKILREQIENAINDVLLKSGMPKLH